MNKKQEKALAVVTVAIVVGSVAQLVAKHEAGIAGLSPLELALVSALASAYLSRTLASGSNA